MIFRRSTLLILASAILLLLLVACDPAAVNAEQGRILKKKGKKNKLPKAPKSKRPKSIEVVLASESPSSPSVELTSPQPTSKKPSSRPTEKPSSQPTEKPSSQPTAATCDQITSEKDALLALKAGFTNAETYLSSWTDTTNPCDGGWWDHISCDGDRVFEILLENADLIGTISPLLGCPDIFTYVDGLFFYGNSFTGSIPDEICDLQDSCVISFIGIDCDEVTCPAACDCDCYYD